MPAIALTGRETRGVRRPRLPGPDPGFPGFRGFGVSGNAGRLTLPASVRGVVESFGRVARAVARHRFLPGGETTPRRARSRTPGCRPLTAATESGAATIPALVEETMRANRPEREGRLIDHDGDASMERRKREGYS